MKILVTGAKGFVGRNLCSQLNNIKTGKAKCYGDLQIDEVFEYDLNSTMEQLDAWCSECDFVFNLAGVNRPQNPEEFMAGNFGFASTLLDTLKKHGNKAPVMLSSSAQASLSGRFGNSEYGRSKKAGEDLFLRYGAENGIKVLVYRFPNLYGKWCRPNYNSAIATFCNNIANDLPITVNDPKVELEVLYIDDLVEEMIAALKGQEHHCEFEGLTVLPSAEGRYCYCPVTHKATLGEIVGLLHQFRDMPKTLMIPEIPADSFAKRLYSTYLSYLPKDKAIFDLKMNCRGSFTELVHTLNCGQVSINISKPGITKGQHWHHTKWEQFIVVSGHGLIQQRKEGTDEVIEFEVSGDKIQSVIMLPIAIAVMVAITFLNFNSNVVEFAIFGGSITIPPVIFGILTVVLVWVSINVTNCSDGVDGLSGTLTIITLISLYMVDQIKGMDPVFSHTILLFVICILAYLWFNATPSKLMMGDAGSRAMGFFISIAALKTGSPFIYIPVAIVLILDGGLGLLKVSLLRFLKIRILVNTRTPLHDHVRKVMGWSNTQAVFRFAIIQIMISAAVIYLIM